MRGELGRKGVDAWWLDASEPEVDMGPFREVQTAQGRAARVLNAWPLMHTRAVYEGQRAAVPNKRVFILTRSAYAGQQRSGAAVWSGDLVAAWLVYAHQIPAGLNFCLSGTPYWTTDIGGFFVDYPGGSTNPEYRELFTRWFQWGAFCPIFRVHGTDTPKELWRFGPRYEPILARADRLRYRLMPYLYSQAWQVTAHAGTIMRALVMDFPHDVAARESKDEFLFGPAMLVCPVTQRGATTRPVYLPGGTRWTNFWTGQSVNGGRTITAPAPIDILPLYIRAGSIIPMGPFLQYASEKPDGPIELRVYRGANGAFMLYEDEGDSYRYEKGAYAAIPITWNEAAKTLIVGARRGRFPGMQKRRTFKIIWVRPGRGVGLAEAAADATIHYRGLPVSVKASR
jgi:alpha-D-xyloside xylohydrolase